MNSKFLVSIILFALFFITCKNQEEIRKYNVPPSCVSISRTDSDYLIRNEVNSLNIAVNGISLNELEIELTMGEVLSFNYGICKIMVSEGEKTKLTVNAKSVDHPLIEKEFRIVEKP